MIFTWHAVLKGQILVNISTYLVSEVDQAFHHLRYMTNFRLCT